MPSIAEQKYEIVSLLEDRDQLSLKVRICKQSETFVKTVSELYKKDWIKCFSPEDISYIGYLYAAEIEKKPEIIKLFPRKQHTITTNVVILAIAFVTFLIASNLTAFKVVELQTMFGEIDFPAALVFFPLTYFFDDIITEVYGFKISRLVIWCGLLFNIVFSFCTSITVFLPSSKYWQFQDSYSIIFLASPFILLASTFAYFCGEFCNSFILARLKVLSRGQWLPLRVLASTSIGVGIDSVIFCNLAFYHLLPQDVIWNMILTQYIFKVSYELIAMPLTVVLTNYLKRIDNVDYYDFQTKFNPFSLSLKDK